MWRRKIIEPSAAYSDVAYGEHTRQVLDVYLPSGEGPFPVAVFIHGGGWMNGDKFEKLKPDMLQRFLEGGCALVSINYRLIPDAREDGISPPVLGPLYDAKRAVQFTRHHAAQWRLDSEKIAVLGGSAGAFSALWVALSPNMAEPWSSDSVAAESTKVMAVGGANAQTSLDPIQMREWVGPQLTYGAHAFALRGFEDFISKRDEFARWYPKLSPASLVGALAPPIYLEYPCWGLNVPENDKKQYFPHSPYFGIRFREVARECGAECHLAYLGHPDPDFKGDMVDFLIAKLKK